MSPVKEGGRRKGREDKREKREVEGKGQRRREKRKKIGKRQGSTEAAYFKRLVKP